MSREERENLEDREDIVVVAVDGSPASQTAVRWAANTAMKRGIPLRLASSYTMPSSSTRRVWFRRKSFSTISSAKP